MLRPSKYAENPDQDRKRRSLITDWMMSEIKQEKASARCTDEYTSEPGAATSTQLRGLTVCLTPKLLVISALAAVRSREYELRSRGKR